jgi:hypothetical protein
MSSNIDMFRRHSIVHHDAGECWDCGLDASAKTEMRYKCLDSKCENWRHIQCGLLEFCDACIVANKDRASHNLHLQKEIVSTLFQQWDAEDVITYMRRKCVQKAVPDEAVREEMREKMTALTAERDEFKRRLQSQPLLSYLGSYYKYKPLPIEAKSSVKMEPTPTASAPTIQCSKCKMVFSQQWNLDRHQQAGTCHKGTAMDVADDTL